MESLALAFRTDQGTFANQLPAAGGQLKMELMAMHPILQGSAANADGIARLFYGQQFCLFATEVTKMRNHREPRSVMDQ